MLEDNFTPTVRARVPNYRSDTLNGEAWTPTSPLRQYSLKGQPEVSTKYRTGDINSSEFAELQSQPIREHTWITVITGTQSNSSLYEKVRMAPRPRHYAIEDAGGNLNAQETTSSPPRSDQRIVINRHIEDESRLVWKALPSHSDFEDDPRRYLAYSKSTVKILRHGGMHARNGSVCFRRYANSMNGMMLKAGYRGQYTRNNTKEWLWNNYCDLIWYVRRGCDKPRFEILAPADLDAGGNLDALYKYSQHVVAIRAMGGHSDLQVNPEEMGRVKITHETCPRLFHGTYWRYIDSIFDKRVKTRRPRPQRQKRSFLQL